MAALLLVALATHVVPAHYGRDQPLHSVALPSGTPTASVLPPPSTHARPEKTHPLAIAVPAYILLAVIAVGLVWALTNVLLTRLGSGRRQRRVENVNDDSVAAARLVQRIIGTAVEEGLDELARGPVADAIIACWLRLEDAARGAGVPLRRSDTPADTVLRVLGQGGVRSVPLQTLADLYREARFSSHVMDEAARTAAGDALRDIRDDLSRLEPTPGRSGPAHA